MVSESVAASVMALRRSLVRCRCVVFGVVRVDLIVERGLWIPNTPRTNAAIALRFRPEVDGGDGVS